MKRLVIFTLINCILPFFGQAQFKISADTLIAKLSWNNLIIETNAISKYDIDSNAYKLINIKDTSLYCKLYNAMSDSSKIVVLHIILTKKIDKSKENISHTFGWPIKKFRFNDLSWSFNYNENKYFVSASEIKKIKKYWCKRVMDNGSNLW